MTPEERADHIGIAGIIGEEECKRIQANVACAIHSAVIEERESICLWLVRASLGSLAEQIRNREHLVHSRMESTHAEDSRFPDIPDGIP